MSEFFALVPGEKPDYLLTVSDDIVFTRHGIWTNPLGYTISRF